MKTTRLYTLLALLLMAGGVTMQGQEKSIDLNEIANAEPFNKVAQIKGTESLLRDYFSGISNENDTLYVVLCPLMFCPRCEAEIGVVQELLYMRKPDNPMVMIASSPNEQAARKYVAKKFYFEDVIYDTDLSFKSFLAFRTEEPRIPFIMKIDRKSGRLLTGGDYIVINDEFADALIRHTEPMPYYGELWEGIVSFQPAASNCEGNDWEQAEIFSRMAVPSDSNTLVSNITFPKISNGYLTFADELDNSIYLYSLSENADNLSFVGRFAPNESEELSFVSIEHEKYFQLRANNMVLAMCLTGSMINRDTLAFSVSVPNLKYKEGNNMAYYNAPAVVFQNIHNEQEREFVPMELFGSIDSITFIAHESFYYSEELDLLFLASFKGYPYFGLTDERQNPFEERFYEETPLYTVYDTNKKPVGRIGQLGQIHKDLHLGYAYCSPKITSHGSTIAITDGTSGILSIYDNNDWGKPLSTIEVFHVSADDFTIDSTLYGTDEYAYQFQDNFQDMIVDILIDETSIYTLSIEGGCYFKKTFDKNGNLKNAILVPNTIEAHQLEISGLCLVKNKVLAVGFYYDKEKHNMVLYD